MSNKPGIEVTHVHMRNVRQLYNVCALDQSHAQNVIATMEINLLIADKTIR